MTMNGDRDLAVTNPLINRWYLSPSAVEVDRSD